MAASIPSTKVPVVSGGPDSALSLTGQEPPKPRQGERGSAGVANVALMLLPGALLAFTGFNAGGYFPATPAIIAIVLAQILLVRILQVERPFEGIAPATLVAIGALCCYAALTLASALWSGASGRALVEFDRAWMYVLVLVLFGSVRPHTANMRWLVRGLALGAAAVCLPALVSRVAPDVWHTAPDVANRRLSYPVTYWNALGLLAALGVIFCAHLTCSLGERRAVRVLAAAAIPLLSATLLFTFSRGAIVTVAIGLACYALTARPRGLLSGALAVLPPTVVLLLSAYHANLLASADPTTPAAVAQGHHVAFLAGACALVVAALRSALVLRVDARLGLLAGRRFLRPGAKWAAVAGVCLALVLAIPALGVPGLLAHDWKRFASGASLPVVQGDFRQRLTDPSNNGRTELWSVAVHAFESSPVHGYGAGTFQTQWDRHRPRFIYTVNAHSLYLQAMAELGLPGVVALALLLIAVLGGLSLRLRGPRRSLYGVLLAVSLMWALHAGVDWDWEMPVTTIGVLAAAGLGLGPRRASSGGWAPAHNSRMLLALMCLVSVALPVIIIGSQRQLDDAEHALYASDCATASRAALSSIGWLDLRAQPYEVLGFCDLERGLPHLGVEAMARAVSHDPSSWEAHYALAIAKAAAGIDPRASVRQALQMNPQDPLTRQAALALDTSSASEWVRRAAALRAGALGSMYLSIAPS